MTVLHNDPTEFAEDQLAGFADLYADRLSAVPGGVVGHRGNAPRVAVVIGGGSGHYPAFTGLVGPGFATGAVVGNIFTSPSAAQVYSVAKSASEGQGVVLSFGNYAGDVLNFGIAAERLRAEGIDTRIVLVTDDVASSIDPERRRGVAGDFMVFRIMGAAAAAGMSLDDVERLGQRANDATRTFGVAFTGCTMPGANRPLFDVASGSMGVGLGIHGEPGIRDQQILSADGLASMLVEDILKVAPDSAGERVTVMVNGLGTTKYEELFILWGAVAGELRAAGLELVSPEVGEFVTSLDMGGCSVTVMWLDRELEDLWESDAYTPAYRKSSSALSNHVTPAHSSEERAVEVAPEASAGARERASLALDVMIRVHAAILAEEVELGRIDAVAGDGDHGRGMVKGSAAALEAAQAAAGDGAGLGWVLRKAGAAWAEHAGGTSGVLWGAALEAAGSAVDDRADRAEPTELVRAVEAFARALTHLGGAKLGDKTMVDAVIPYAAATAACIDSHSSVADATRRAARDARHAAEQTAALRPQLGRARPLAEKSIGTPDAGATSFALIVSVIADSLANEESGA
jgi:dihydroxyacetone kinase